MVDNTPNMVYLNQLRPTHDPVEGFVRPSWRVRCCVCSLCTKLMTTYPYFDHFKFDVFDALFLSATLSRLDCAQVDFYVSTDSLRGKTHL